MPPGDPEALAAAVRRILEEPGLRDRLAAAAKPSVEALSSDIVYGKLEALLSEAGAAMTDRPRVLFVGTMRATGCHCQAGSRRSGTRSSRSSTTASWARRPPTARRATRASGSRRPSARMHSTELLFYLRLPLRIRREIRRFRPDAIFASDPVLGAAGLVGRALAGGSGAR